MSFEILKEEVRKGLEGKNGGIPMGFNRLNRYVGIRKSMYYLVGGLTGSGKTSFIDDAFVLNPVDWVMSPEGQTSGIKIKIWYRSMERSRTYKLAKWTSRRIFLDHGVTIGVNKLLGWTEQMNEEEHKLFLSYEDYMNKLSEIITIISDFGKYNSINYDTIFSKNVKIKYLENIITSEYLDFSMIKNLMIISKNVIYKSPENILNADVVEVDIRTKDTKIFMYDTTDKINIKSVN